MLKDEKFNRNAEWLKVRSWSLFAVMALEIRIFV